MKKIDCPLCGAKDAITYTEPEIFTDFTPGPAGIIGNSKMGFLGGGYDWSHANACPKLQKVKYPKELLEYFEENQPLLLTTALQKEATELNIDQLVYAGFGLAADEVAILNSSYSG